MRTRIKRGAVKVVSCRGGKLIRYAVAMLVAYVMMACANAQPKDYTCTDQEYAIVDSMYRACMSSEELRQDFKWHFPEEYAIMMSKGAEHDCLECRIKAIRSCFDDPVWADMFDDENSYCISHQFLVTITVNEELGALWNNIGKSLED